MVKIKYIIYLVPLLLFSCARSLQPVKIKINKFRVYYIDLPRKHEVIWLSGSHFFEKQFWYSDSTVIYFVNSEYISNINGISIHNTDLFYKRHFELDTLTIEGTRNNLYWKDKKLKHISIGYANVPLSKKTLFDSVLNTIRTNRR